MVDQARAAGSRYMILAPRGVCCADASGANPGGVVRRVDMGTAGALAAGRPLAWGTLRGTATTWGDAPYPYEASHRDRRRRNPKTKGFPMYLFSFFA